MQIQNDPEVNQDCDVLVPLPVELISFDAKYNNSQVVLRWATASEKDALNFAVERSSDAKNFSPVAVVQAAGNSSTRRDYEATDRNVRNGLSYYRLKQTDLDGTFTYSPVVPVQVGDDAQPQRLEAYGDQGNLNIVLQMPGTVQQLRVLDMMGRVLYTESIPEGATGLVTRSVPMGSENRVYMVQAVTSEGVVSKKFATMR
ncbi:T9SS type A sorting domain-containing protein [Hymenobacter tibetensis]|uniref:T9SS type A sorting domain-containing protein n=1 Tax=Hymenobacter tibetensis TaxID=497967 RepID=A0ABY4CTX0_9BACT|nr:T9SS type A sorting domain-containing protein [Hymenobacter tibetensis]UOG73716.1 T9SS type A sorting domain-containing protein [Hymenobacter tibetensis]